MSINPSDLRCQSDSSSWLWDRLKGRRLITSPFFLPTFFQVFYVVWCIDFSWPVMRALTCTDLWQEDKANILLWCDWHLFFFLWQYGHHYSCRHFPLICDKHACIKDYKLQFFGKISWSDHYVCCGWSTVFLVFFYFRPQHSVLGFSYNLKVCKMKNIT